MKIRWSPTATSDLKSICEYISRDNPASVERSLSESNKPSIVLSVFLCLAEQVAFSERAN
jgi:hypothetical protein